MTRRPLALVCFVYYLRVTLFKSVQSFEITRSMSGRKVFSTVLAKDSTETFFGRFRKILTTELELPCRFVITLRLCSAKINFP